MTNLNTLFLRKSRNPGDLGGYIEDNSDIAKGSDELIYLIGSDSSFFCGQEYKAFYVKNVSNEPVKFVDVVINGGRDRGDIPVPYSFISDLPTEEKLALSSPVSWFDYYHDKAYNTTLFDDILSRYNNNSYPFTSEISRKLSLAYGSSDYSLAAVQVWMKANIYDTAYTRSSLLNQVDIKIIPSVKRVASSINTNGVGNYINLTNGEQRPSYLPTRVVDEIKPGEFWTFYVKMTYNFSHKTNYFQDISFLSFSWVDHLGNYQESPLTKLVFQASYEEITTYHSDIVASMYNSYPPFFGEFDEQA